VAHVLRIDNRIEITKKLIAPLKIEFDSVIETCKSHDVHFWDSIYADDAEHIAGIVFIILQNYINSSISDLFPELKDLYLKYEEDKFIGISQITRIQLIIALANFYKHRDLSEVLRKNTSDPFKDLNIKYIEHSFTDELHKVKYSHSVGASSPVFTGFSLLSELWDFNDLIKIATEWRENMWSIEEKAL